MIIEIALVGIAAFFLLLNIEKVMQNAKKHPVIVIVIIILFIVFSASQIWQQHIKDMESSPTGSISSNTKNIIYPCIMFGTSTMVGAPGGFVPMSLNQSGLSIADTRSAGESNPIQSDEDKMIIWIENGKLKISTVVRDKDGKILAKIVGNEFFTMPRPAILDRNYDENSLEVVDVYGNVVLQASLIGSCVKILGIFFDKSGNAIVADENGFVIYPRSFNAKINPIFVHPCEGHLGERIKKD